MSLPIMHLLFCRWLAPVLVVFSATVALALPVGEQRDTTAHPADAEVPALAPLSRSWAWATGRLATTMTFAAGSAALGQDLSWLRAAPLAPLMPQMPLSRIRVIDLDRPLPGLRLGDMLSPGAWAGRYVLGRIRGGRVIELSGWWGSALLPLGRGGTAGGAGSDARLAGIVADRLAGADARPVPGRSLMPGPGPDLRPFLPRDGGPGRLPDLIPPGPVASGPAVPEVPMPVPLPGALGLLGGAIAALALIRRRRGAGGPPG